MTFSASKIQTEEIEEKNFADKNASDKGIPKASNEIGTENFLKIVYYLDEIHFME